MAGLYPCGWMIFPKRRKPFGADVVVALIIATPFAVVMVGVWILVWLLV